MSRSLPLWSAALALIVSAPALARPHDKDDSKDKDKDEEKALIEPVGQLQIWATVMDQDVSETADPASYGDPEADPGFEIYRARAGAEGTIPGPDLGQHNELDWRVLVGASPPYDVPFAAMYGESTSVGLVDAWARWTLATGFGATQVQLGLQSVPFNRERIMSSTDLLFQERAVGGEWTGASRDVGVTASQVVQFGEGKLPPRVKATVGVYNGEITSTFGNPAPGLMELGRLEFELGDAYRTWDPDGAPAVGVGGAVRNGADPSGTSFTYEADLLLRVWYVCLYGEFSQQQLGLGDATLAPQAVLDGTGRRGAMGQLSFFIPIQDAQGVEVGAQYAMFDDDLDVVDTGDVGVLHAGATWRDALPGFDLGAGYIHRTEPAEVGAWANDSVRVWTQIRPRRANIQ